MYQPCRILNNRGGYVCFEPGSKWKITYHLSIFVSLEKCLKKKKVFIFPGGSLVKNLPANAGDMGLTPDLRRSHMLQS